MKTTDLAILAIGAYLILPELAKKAGEGAADSAGQAVKETIDSGYHFVRANVPQVNVFTNPSGKTYYSYTPPLLGPLSAASLSSDPDTWKSWLV